jgi:phospholipase/carboxylesterase
VLCHGFGAPGDDLVGLAAALRAPPGTSFVFPEAPLSLVPPGLEFMGDSRAWWPIDVAAIERARERGEVRDLSRQVPKGIAEARSALVGMLEALEAAQPTARLVLGGFSQGAMLALDVALRHPERPFAGVVLMSGTLLAEDEWTSRMPARKGLRVFQSHGEEDPLLPFFLAERLRDRLVEAGLEVTFVGPHTIPDATMDKLGAWLRALP